LQDMETPREGTNPASRQLTLREWVDLPDDVEGEWEDGWLVEEEVPSIAHELAVTWLIVALHAWLRPRDGMVLASAFKYAVSEKRGRIPDVSAFFAPRGPPAEARYGEMPPDIAVEVVTDRARDVRRDRVEKVAEYAAFGIPRYWILDPQSRTFEALELVPDRGYLVAIAASAGKFEVPGCEGLALDLDELWAQMDRLGQRV
jgi:Uma2 family endonuclease